jgi:transposase-like protein
MQSVLSDIHYHSEEAAYAYVEARIWPDGPECPHCGNVDRERIGKLNGKTTRIGLYKCYACRLPFNVKIGTIFEKSHAPMRVWLQAIYLMSASKKGISTRQLQRTFQCGLKTAWFLGHRVREAVTVLNLLDSGSIGGDQLCGANHVVEADETFVGGKARNRTRQNPAQDPGAVAGRARRPGPQLPCSGRDRAELKADHRQPRQQGDLPDNGRCAGLHRIRPRLRRLRHRQPQRRGIRTGHGVVIEAPIYS